MSLDDDVLSCEEETWVRGVRKEGSIHAQRLKEHLGYWSKYLSDLNAYGKDHISHYYNHQTGEFFYEVETSPTRVQEIIEETTGVKKHGN